MTLFLDGQVLPGVGHNVKTVGELLRYLSSLPELQGRLVSSITVGGLEVEAWDDQSEVKLEPDADIRVVTQSVTQMLAETTMTCRDYLPKLRDGAIQAATLFHEFREQEAFELMNELVGGLQWYNEFLGHVASLRDGERERASAALKALDNVFRQLLSAWESGDFTLLADLLEYELTPALDNGMEYIEFLATGILKELGNGQ